jgi:F1F0 ATPase subunit 2
MFYLQKSILCAVAGIAIGCFHFGGLWLTVRGVGEGKFKGFLFFASFLGRFFVTLAAIFLASGGQWYGVLFCVAGMLLARRLFVSTIGLPKAPDKKEFAS